MVEIAISVVRRRLGHTLEAQLRRVQLDRHGYVVICLRVYVLVLVRAVTAVRG